MRYRAVIYITEKSEGVHNALLLNAFENATDGNGRVQLTSAIRVKISPMLMIDAGRGVVPIPAPMCQIFSISPRRRADIIKEGAMTMPDFAVGDVLVAASFRVRLAGGVHEMQLLDAVKVVGHADSLLEAYESTRALSRRVDLGLKNGTPCQDIYSPDDGVFMIHNAADDVEHQLSFDRKAGLPSEDLMPVTFGAFSS